MQNVISAKNCTNGKQYVFIRVNPRRTVSISSTTFFMQRFGLLLYRRTRYAISYTAFQKLKFLGRLPVTTFHENLPSISLVSRNRLYFYKLAVPRNVNFLIHNCVRHYSFLFFAFLCTLIGSPSKKRPFEWRTLMLCLLDCSST